MARDNHPRDRQRARIERKEGRRAPGRRFLIVCEGKKTEPYYLEELRTTLRLPTANLHIEAARRAIRMESRFDPANGPWTSLPALLQFLLDPDLDFPDPGADLRCNADRLSVLETRLEELFPKARASRPFAS